MARVQVRDLPSAPRLQATVQSGGDFGVAVQQAGSNKMLNLAYTLSGFNKALEQYGAFAVVEAESAEQELKRLKPEERSERLSKTEKELDSLTRKGVIPWLASPLNQKRKRRAEGKAAHDLFLQRLVDAEGRFNNPQEGDDDKTTAQIIEEERQAFVAENPALQEGTYGGEGFQEALNPTILNLTRQYDGEKARVARAETLLQNTSAIYRLAKDAPLESAEYDLVMEQSLGSWAELNSFNAAQQIKVIENVAEQLANLPGGEQRAYEFLQYAEQNFYVGNQLFYKNEDQVDRIMNLIEREVEVGQRIREGNRGDRLEEEKGEFVIALSALQSTGKTTYKGAEYTDSFELLKAAEEFARNDPDTRFGGAVIPMFEQVIKGDLDAEQIQRDRILDKSPVTQQAPRRIGAMVDSIVMASNLPPEIKNNPQYERIVSDTVLEFNDKIKDQLNEMIRTGMSSDLNLAGRRLDEFTVREMDATRQILSDRLNKLGETTQEQNNLNIQVQEELNSNDSLAVPIITSESLVESASRFVSPVLRELILPNVMQEFAKDTPESLVDKTIVNLRVLRNAAATKENREKAKQILNERKEAALKHLAQIAAPDSSRPYKPIDYVGMTTSEFTLAIATGGRSLRTPYTLEEREEARKRYFELARWSGTFQDIETLENKVTKDGERFEYGEDISSVNTLFLTEDEMERAKKAGSSPDAVPADVKRKAGLVGEADDILKFIRQQDDLHRTLKISNK
jgi:hypothetical protein